MTTSKIIMCIVGARPNFIKIAPIMRALKKSSCLSPILVHTGQHYDETMSGSFFNDLAIDPPDINLEVGSGSHSFQTAEIIKRFEPVIVEKKPDAILVVGDVNSTLACSLVAAKLCVPIIHVEAGLRSYDRSMPEEINRVLTDQISELLYTTDPTAREALKNEGINLEREHFVGNVMVDSLMWNLDRAAPAFDTLSAHLDTAAAKDITDSGYALLTLHRPSNVDTSEVLTALLGAISEISKDIPIVFPAHPRTQAAIEKFELQGTIGKGRIHQLPPLPYLQLVGILKDAKLVLSDSGGLQEESTALGIPCLTLRHNTERPITVTMGTNVIAGNTPSTILDAYKSFQKIGGKAGQMPPLWDGHAAERIIEHLEKWLNNPPNLDVKP